MPNFEGTRNIAGFFTVYRHNPLYDRMRVTRISEREGEKHNVNQMNYASMPRMERNGNLPRKTQKKRMPLWVRIISVLLIWSLVGWGCFMLVRHYIQDIQQQLDHIVHVNAQETAALQEQLTALQTALYTHQQHAELLQAQFAAVESELEAVKEQMSLAGSSLSTTAETRQALSDRITDLSKELTELRKLIRKLEEAARVY